MMRKGRIIFTALMAVLALIVPMSAQAVAPTGSQGAPSTMGNLHRGGPKAPQPITPIAPSVSHATGKCWAGEWKVANDGKITLPKVANAKWQNYGSSKTLTDLAPGTYHFRLQATNGASIKNVNGFKNGKISVTVKAPKKSQDCGPPKPKVETSDWSHWKIDCSAGKASKTRTITTTGYVWSDKHGKWVEGKATTKTDTETRKLTRDEKRECNPQPDPKIEHGKWSKKWTVDCEAGHAYKTRSVTTINYKWDGKHNKWVLDRKNAETKTERDTRELTNHEKRECNPKPDPIIEYGKWSKWDVNCDAGKATKSRTVTTTDHTWSKKKGTWVTDKPQVKTETKKRHLTNDERRECTPKPEPIIKQGKWSKWNVDCEAGQATKSRTVTTTDYIWNSKKKAWVIDSGNSTTTTDQKTRGLKDHEKRECTPKPEPLIKYGKWSKWDVNCEAGKATKSRTVSTTDYFWSSKKGDWVAGKPFIKTETKKRHLTNDERRECTPKPEPIIKYGKWSKWNVDCEAGKATKSRTVTTTDYIWNSKKKAWVIDSGNSTTTTDQKTRSLKDHEKRECTPKPEPIIKYGKWSKWDVNCEAGKATKSRTVSTTDYFWSSKKGDWVAGKPFIKTETKKRHLTNDERRECTPKPEPIIKYSKWSKWNVDCEAGKATKSRTVTTIDHVWNSKHGKWEADYRNSSTTKQYDSRGLKNHEKRECTPKPEPLIKHGKWSKWNVECEAGKATKSRTRTEERHVGKRERSAR